MRILFISVLTCILFGCSPSVSLRKDIFQNQPLWESGAFSQPSAMERGRSLAAVPDGVDREEAPGLYQLVKQVLPERASVLRGGGRSTNLRISSARSAQSGIDILPEDDPLPPTVANLAVTRAAVRSALAAYLSEQLPDQQLSVQDFRQFGEELQRSTLRTFQSNQANEDSRVRLAKLSAFQNDKKLTLQGLLKAYFTAYYSDKFVDRTGGALSKPAIGLKITNDTITNAATVGLEALFDYAAIRSKVANPIVYTQETGKAPKFQTADNRKPTLVHVIEQLMGRTDDASEEIAILGVLEPLQTDESKPGITEEKLKYIRLFSGYAGDASGSLSDFITRTFGGIHVGFVLMGKLSIGDNDTLAKLIQTATELTAKRATEMFVGNYLYQRVRVQGGRSLATTQPATVEDTLRYRLPE